MLPELAADWQGLVASDIPIATGERLYSRAKFLPVLQAGVPVL